MLDYSAVLQHDIPFWRVKKKKGLKEGIVCSLYFAKLVHLHFHSLLQGWRPCGIHPPLYSILYIGWKIGLEEHKRDSKRVKRNFHLKCKRASHFIRDITVEND